MKRFLAGAVLLFVALLGAADAQFQPRFNQPPRNVGTISQAAQQRAPFVIGKSGIPFIGLSTGSIDATGNITAITALPIAYPKAYCYFPANALATSIAAGWYYCTFSTTTAGVAFLNTYTSGTPTIPASPTAVTDGKGAYTGDTGEEMGPTITIPANSLGANSLLRVITNFEETNNANGKTVRHRWSGSSGTIVNTASAASSLTVRMYTDIWTTGASNTQRSNVYALTTGLAVTAPGLLTVTTTADTTFVTSLQRTTATDNLVLDAYDIVLYSDGT